MNTQQIIEGNILIDIFMDNWLISRGFSESELNYNSDWGTLMPVVEKIGRTKFGENHNYSLVEILVTICNKHYHVSTKLVKSVDTLWLAVVNWIKWSNESK